MKPGLARRLIVLDEHAVALAVCSLGTITVLLYAASRYGEDSTSPFSRRATGGRAKFGGILQAASPLLGMIPGIGPIASAIMSLIGLNLARSAAPDDS